MTLCSLLLLLICVFVITQARFMFVNKCINVSHSCNFLYLQADIAHISFTGGYRVVDVIMDSHTKRLLYQICNNHHQITDNSNT